MGFLFVCSFGGLIYDILQIKKFYQSRKSQRTVLVQITGEKIPLYGSGATLIPPAPPAPLPKPKKKKKGAPVVIPDPPVPPAPVPM